MEETDLIPEDSKRNDSESPSDIDDASLKQNIKSDISETIPESNESLKGNDLNVNELDNNSVTSKSSLFNRFLKEGFDGITKNPNYKLLALLIILLINLSLFLLVGNLGKSFLENSGLLN